VQHEGSNIAADFAMKVMRGHSIGYYTAQVNVMVTAARGRQLAAWWP
jgi:hypothetical protein